MKRAIALLALVLVVVSAGGCKAQVEIDSPEAGKTGSESQGSAERSANSADAMSTDGPGESAAVAAIPEALEQAKQMRESAKMVWPDLSGIDPQLTAYILIAEMNGQTALFEVRADGTAHSLYAYQQAFDSGTIVWTPAEHSGTGRQAPQSAPEQAAVAAVQDAMREAFPDGAVTVSIYGYRFSYLDGDTSLLALEIAVDGSVISAGS